MSFDEVMALRKRVFFFLYGQTARLEADDGRRQLQLLIAAQSSEGVKQAFEALNNDLGVVYQHSEIVHPVVLTTDDDALDPQFDRAALRALKARHGV